MDLPHLIKTRELDPDRRGDKSERIADLFMARRCMAWNHIPTSDCKNPSPKMLGDERRALVDAAGAGLAGPLMQGPVPARNVRAEPSGMPSSQSGLWNSVYDRPAPANPITPDSIAAAYRRLGAMTSSVPKTAGLY